MYRSLRLSIVVFVLGGCGGGGDGVREECNPLGGTQCMMPWPWSGYLVEADTVTGYQLALPAEAMPVNLDGKIVEADGMFNRYDGFGPSGTILAAFPAGVSADGLPTHQAPEASLAADSPVVVVDMDSGDRVLVFAEVDMNANDPTARTLIIHPLERMEPNHHYAVGIRNTVKDSAGAALPVSEAMQAMLDGGTFDHPLMARVQGDYPAIFTALAAAGLPQAEIVLAWDFRTASQEFLTSDLLTMRDAALPLIGDAGANMTFEGAEQSGEDPARVLRFITGTYTAPNFLTDGEDDTSILIRGADGLPEVSGTYTANFAAIVPRCIETATLPVQVMIFGHGLFGDGEDSLQSGLLQDVAQDYCFVVVAGDFIGLTGRQFAAAAFAANDLNRGRGLTEKLAQALINFISLENVVRGPMSQSDLFKFNGNEIIDPTRVHYFGASLGGIMGNVFMAYDPTVMRGALGVPGGAWSLLFERSFAWSALQGALIGSYGNDYPTYQLLTAMLGFGFEPYDPITTAPGVTGEVGTPVAGVPAKQIIVYEGIGDCLVGNMATETVARTMGLPLASPSLKTPYGIQPMEGEATSGFTIYDQGRTPLPPIINVPPEVDNGTHSDVNEEPANLRQIERFFNEGVVSNECMLEAVASECDCTVGACN